MSADLLRRRVEGHHVEPGPLEAVLGTTTTLLVFLRHYG
jgi:hypothetical protein